jgi:AraC-like DNA-binding protein
MNTVEDARMWCVPKLGGLEMLSATFITYAFKRHMHDYFVIGMIEDGFQTFDYRGAKHRTPPGGLILLNPCEAHTGEPATDAGFVYRALYPQAEMLAAIASDMSERPRDVPFFPTPVVHDKTLLNAILGLHKALEKSAPTLEQESRFLWTLGHLILRHADSPVNLPAIRSEKTEVRRIRDYIDEHYAEEITLDQLAALVNWNRFYLLRVFRGAVGLPPHAYQESIRIRWAQDMLRRGLPLAQIAYDTGFSSQSHLTSSFKRLIGVTPGHYAGQVNFMKDKRRALPLS